MASSCDINILSDETFDKICVACKRKNKNSKAEKYCIDCQDYYCSKCVKVHEDVPLLSDHEILDKDKFPSGSSSTLTTMPKAPTEQCERHKHKHVDMYCEDHGVVGCSTCMVVDHGSCQGRFYISEYSKADVNTAAIEEKLKLIAKSLDENQTYFQNKKQLLLNERRKLLEDIKRLRKEINDKLDELEKITLKEVQYEFYTLIKEAEKQFNILKTYKEDVKSTLDKFGFSNISESQKFVNCKKGKRIVDRVDEQLEDLSQYMQNNTVAFEPFKEIQDLLDIENGLGNAKQKLRQDSLLKVRGNEKLSVRVKTDKNECEIVSGCVVRDNIIILSDRGNSNLKRFDISVPTMKENYKLPGSTWQVCAVGPNKVAVCLPITKTVHFVSVQDKMAKSNEIKTDFNCYGIAYSCGTLYISDNGSSVYVYNISGEKLKQFTYDSSGNSLFKDIYTLAVSKTRIYVADINNGLVILDKDGAPAGKVDEPKILLASSCCFTTRNNLLVYDKYQRGILQYMENGDSVGTVVKQDINFFQNFKNLKTIICNKEMTYIIVAGRNDNVLVYKLIEEM